MILATRIDNTVCTLNKMASNQIICTLIIDIVKLMNQINFSIEYVWRTSVCETEDLSDHVQTLDSENLFRRKIDISQSKYRKQKN